ncbi:MAG TPA: hypothetical protein VK949_06985, partial [Methylotenera sp.]|nr:hypothetical protein [Methylotenera sp.]
LIQILTILFGLYLVYLASGDKMLNQEVLSIWAAQQSLIAVVPVFVFICMNRAIFLVSKQLDELGHWHNDTFVYNAPQQIFTITVSSEDNDKTHLFKVKDAEINSLVTVGLDIDRQDERVKAQITENGHRHIDWRGATPIIRSGFRLPRNRKLGLLTLTDTEVNPTTIRVYAYSWQLLR